MQGDGVSQIIRLKPIEYPGVLRVAFVNNMPDSALQATEAQFCALLHEASSRIPIQLQLAYLPQIERSAVSMDYLKRRYVPIDALFESPPDALIVTGTEPLAATVRQERYWARFAQLVDWADSHTYSSIWSCLGAHAAVDHLDGIPRRRLAHKRCGLFQHGVDQSHPLMDGVDAPLPTPQSRWNELPAEDLERAGYRILSTSAESGANIFVRRRRSLMVFFQGHPEYDAATLMKEYRRDVERFFRGEYTEYPQVPSGYFSPPALALLQDYKVRALSASESDRERFPYAALAPMLANSWRKSAIQIYKNWLNCVAASKDVIGVRQVAQ
jgi:homoserine O-succinyltransferase